VIIALLLQLTRITSIGEKDLHTIISWNHHCTYGLLLTKILLCGPGRSMLTLCVHFPVIFVNAWHQKINAWWTDLLTKHPWDISCYLSQMRFCALHWLDCATLKLNDWLLSLSYTELFSSGIIDLGCSPQHVAILLSRSSLSSFPLHFCLWEKMRGKQRQEF
jgi:hypothetical protein